MVGMQLSFTLNDDVFCLKSAVTSPNFVYQVKLFRLVIKKIKCIESFQLSFEAKLLKQPASYILDVYSVKTFIIPEKVRTFQVSDAFSQQFVPEFCLVGKSL